jgi:1-acyl-sn-glycerol-3-phosphate acyltransferase
MSLHSIIVGIRALILIPFSIFALGCIATLLLFLRVNEGFINGPLAKHWARIVIWLAAARVTVQGTRNIPSTEESYIVAMNHQSNMDIPILIYSLPVQLRFIGKVEIRKVPVFGSALIKAGHFLIDRRDHQKAMEGIRAAGELLRQRGVSVVFAPEGTRSRNGKLLPFKKGAFVMAIETGIPILPVTIDGSRLSLPKGSFWARKTEVTVSIHQPLPTESLSYDDRDELSEKTRSIIEKSLGTENGK